LRFPFACGPSCRICTDTSALDSETVGSTLEHAQQSGQGRVYLQGVNLVANPNLPAVARAARACSLEIAVVEDAPDLSLPDRIGSLAKMEIGYIYLSLPGLPAGSDVPRAWRDALVALARTRRAFVGAHVPLTPDSARAHSALLRVLAEFSIPELLVSDVVAADGLEPLDAAAAVETLEHIWREASASHVRLRVIGFDRTRHVHAALGAAAPAIDMALVEFIRRGIPLPSLHAGVYALGGPDRRSQLGRLAKDAGEMRGLGLELAARGSPFLDLPVCLGGVQLTGAAATANDFVKSDACPACVFDARCAGARPLTDVLSGSELRAALRPFPAWNACGDPPRILILSSYGHDPVFYASTLPGLAADLRQRGAAVEIVSPWLTHWDPDHLPVLPNDIEYLPRWEGIVSRAQSEDRTGDFDAWLQRKRRALHWRWIKFTTPRWESDWTGTSGIEAWLGTHDLSAFDLVIASDFDAARLVLDRDSLRATARLVVLDFHMLRGMNDALRAWLPSGDAARGGWWPSEQLVLQSGFPGFVTLYRNYGIPLEQIAWRPFPLYQGHFPVGPDVHASPLIMSGGNHLRDLETLRAATERLAPEVHPVVLFDQGEPFEGNAHLLHEGAVALWSFYHAIANSRFVVVPLREDTNRAAGVTVVAMALMAGRPVVATGIAAIRDYVRHGAEALLVAPGDPEALADAITQLDTDAALLRRLAEGARTAGRRLSTAYWAEQIISGIPPTPVSTAHGWRSW
jgi:hypothetical protein